MWLRTGESAGRTIRVVTYNVLSSTLEDLHQGITPEKRHFDYHTLSSLSSSDFLCLQEIDHYEDHYQALLASWGYKSIYVQRLPGWDGCLIAYKPPWSLLLSRTIDFDDLPQAQFNPNFVQHNVGLLGLFEADGVRLCIGVAHLFWNPQYPDIKLEQAKWYLSRGSDLACKAAADAVVLTGDFNSFPDSEVVQEMQRPKIVGKRLFSAYKDYKEGQHPAFTNFTYKFVGCLDYIFHSGNLVPRELLQTPEEAECRAETALPNSQQGSDHVPLGALLELI